MDEHGEARRPRGARFPSVAQLRCWEAEQEQQRPDPTPEPPTDPNRALALPEPASAAPEPFEPEPSEAEPSGPPGTVSVRPYVLTGGRTRPGSHLGLETLVSARDPAGTQASHTHRAIVEMCAQPKSVAEVAALTTLPLGVVRVLVNDLADAGELFVHRAVTDDGPPDAALLSRLLRGLQDL
ncbi:MAG: DUF742 domain-containing protein [Pseudonocardiaceae bacterium]